MKKGKTGTDKENLKAWCPCNKYEDEDEICVECEECLQWWHLKCVALHKLPEETIKDLEEWRCPRCIMETLGMGNTIVQETVKAEIAKAVPGIVKSVVEATVKAKEFQKSFADAVTGRSVQMEKKVEKTVEKTMHTAIKENQETLLQKASQKQDADNYERDRRKRNVVVKNVRESSLLTPKGRYNSDINKLEKILQVNKEDIVTCYRAGAKRENGGARLLIVTLATPSIAEQLHNYGAGCRIETSSDMMDIWINPDLIKSDRDANYNARKLMREKRAMLEGKRQKNVETAVQKKPTENSKEDEDEKPVAEKNKEASEETETTEVTPDDSISVVSNGGKFL